MADNIAPIQPTIPQANGNNNFGFIPATDIGGGNTGFDASNGKCRDLKEKISKLLARHPNLQLRSSIKLLDKLEDCTEEQLENMLLNAQNDVSLLHGTPAALLIINFFGSLIDKYFVPGFLEECLLDDELKRDIETELFDKIGVLNSFYSIPMRTAANAMKASEKNKRKIDDLNFTTVVTNAQETKRPKNSAGDQLNFPETGFYQQAGISSTQLDSLHNQK